MKLFRSFLLIYLLPLCLTAQLLTAQTPLVEVDVSIYSRQYRGNIYFESPGREGLTPETVSVEIRNNPIENSAFRRYSGPPQLNLYNEPLTWTVDEEGNPVPVPRSPIATIGFPSQATAYLLMMLPGTAETTTLWRIIPIDCSDQAFPLGQTMIANLSNRQLQGLVQNNRVNMGPGITRPQNLGQEVAMDLGLVNRYGDVVTAVNTVFFCPRGLKSVVFFNPPILRGSSILNVSSIHFDIPRSNSR